MVRESWQSKGLRKSGVRRSTPARLPKGADQLKEKHDTDARLKKEARLQEERKRASSLPGGQHSASLG